MKPVLRMYTEVWKRIFEMVKDIDNSKPLTPKILSDPSNKFVKMLIYIYSMQTFIFSEMNRASRAKDVSKIQFYGPLASALSFVIHSGNKQQTDLAKQFTVFRGLQISQRLESKYRVARYTLQVVSQAPRQIEMLLSDLLLVIWKKKLLTNYLCWSR